VALSSRPFADKGRKLVGPASRVRAAAKSGEVALAGRDGAAARDLLAASKAAGVRVLSDLTREAVEELAASIAAGGNPSELWSDDQRWQLADALASTNATAELLGQSRIRERQQKADAAGGLHKLRDEQPFEAFAGTPVEPLPPQQAIDYFQSLTPKLTVDPEFTDRHERQAFTLARATEDVLLRKVKGAILSRLQTGLAISEATADIQALLDAAGVTPANPQYAEMVFRTNMMDSYNVGADRERQDPDVVDTFPVWQYLGIDDERAGEDHRPKFGRYYPSSATFPEVRGERVWNCRCTQRPVDKWEWADLQARGARVESSW
jgi:hypothetical protein